MTRDLETAVAAVAAAFDELGVEYYLAGSVVSSLFGIARATADVDVVARLAAAQAPRLLELLGCLAQVAAVRRRRWCFGSAG